MIKASKEQRKNFERYMLKGATSKSIKLKHCITYANYEYVDLAVGDIIPIFETYLECERCKICGSLATIIRMECESYTMGRLKNSKLITMYFNYLCPEESGKYKDNRCACTVEIK